MKRLISFFLIIVLVFLGNSISAQNKSTYTFNGTTYINGETYSTTGKPKVERSTSAKTKFLKSRRLKKIPNGYQLDHIVPLSEGGADVPSNMQIISVDQHKRKTARERAENSTSSTYRSTSYKSNSTYKSSNKYSTPSYSNSSGKTNYTGPKGGTYYINSYGNKTYVKKK